MAKLMSKHEILSTFTPAIRRDVVALKAPAYVEGAVELCLESLWRHLQTAVEGKERQLKGAKLPSKTAVGHIDSRNEGTEDFATWAVAIAYASNAFESKYGVSMEVLPVGEWRNWFRTTAFWAVSKAQERAIAAEKAKSGKAEVAEQPATGTEVVA